MSQEKESAAIEAWEAYLAEQKLIVGMPGLHARPSFIAGYQAALRALAPAPAIVNARIVGYDEMDEESKEVWDRHLETQRRIFGQ
ncbi:hypothetical protein [Paraburkholderia sp. SIMBA_054]|uniref:hypothetical protein n=1 Tax=Paraburkholderia sp. SIMBA_054 TaxID=3085795 RepID=UPI00397C663D